MKLPTWFLCWHKHIITVDDMATGVSLEAGVPVTAFRYKCIICGRTFDDITEMGIRQLEEGHKRDKVLDWINK